VLARFAEKFPDARNLPVYRSNLALARADFDGAAAAAQTLLSAPPALQAAATGRLATLAAVRGQLREAARFTDQRLAIDARRYGWSPDEAALERGIADLQRTFDFREADPREVERLWALNQRVAAGRRPADRNYLFFTEAFIRAGAIARARTVANEYRDAMGRVEGARVLDRFFVDYAESLVLAGEGRLADALQAYRRGCDLIRSYYAVCDADVYEARLYQQMGATDSAVAVFERYFAFQGDRGDEWVARFAADLRRLGEAYESKGERAQAIGAYGKFVELWKDADPELQPMVKDARERIARLSRQEG
jgi:tetratricopeptide (TPR) repeat protein